MTTPGYLPGLESEERRPELSQWYTPAGLAVNVARWAAAKQTTRVLEPSAGRGVLVRAIDLYAPGLISVHAVEIDPMNCRHLETLPVECELTFECGDFLSTTYDPSAFDLCLMNPPYEGNQDTAHVEHAFDSAIRVVGIFASRIVHSQGRADFWRWTDISRLAWLSERPRFGGVHYPMTDFVVLELIRRTAPRRQGDATQTLTEWW